MSDAYRSIRQGLEEALAHAQGENVGAVEHRVEIPDPDVASIRRRTGLSQQRFADSIGVSSGTLKGWEQGRRRPQGPARILLALIDRNPSIVAEALRSER